MLRVRRWKELDDRERDALFQRGLDAIFDDDLRRAIGALIADVMARGDAAVCDALARFDGVTLPPDQLRLTADEIAAATVGRRASTAPSTTPSPTAGRSTSVS